MGDASRKADANGRLFVLNVERNQDGSWVNRNYANPDNVWNGNYRLVFCRNCRSFSPLERGVFLPSAKTAYPTT